MSEKQFRSFFSADPKLQVKAHGRVNLIGEHTDYNGGFVLPTCIPQCTRVHLRARDDRRVRIASLGVPRDESLFEFELGSEKVGSHWSDYVQGVTFVLAREGKKLSGFDCLIESDVPMGSGLSSSAALEVSLLKGLNQLFTLGLDGLHVARLGQLVENDFVGARVGIMDQMAASLGTFGEALFIDTRHLTFERIALPLESVDLIVINSGVAHNHAHGDYNQRRRECEEAARLLNVSELRDLTPADLDRVSALPQPLARRARHVITENDRVLRSVEALKTRDFKTLGRLFDESHLSMRDDYEVSVPQVDRLVELCRAQPAVYGARLTGGGFGGSIVALCKVGSARAVARSVKRDYDRAAGAQATVLVPNLPSVPETDASL